MESKLEKAALPQEESEQVFHRKEDLENHIEKLKVSFFLSVRIIFCEFQLAPLHLVQVLILNNK